MTRPLPPAPLARAIPLLVIAAILLQGCTVALHADTTSQSTVVAELHAQADRWDQAIVRKDRAAIEANMADDFRQIDGSGNVETKASFVTDLVSPDLVIDPYRVEDFNVRVYGDVALLSGARA